MGPAQVTKKHELKGIEGSSQFVFLFVPNEFFLCYAQYILKFQSLRKMDLFSFRIGEDGEKS